MIRSVVKGVGAATPARAVKNAELENVVETSDEWIVQRTGIRQRYIADEVEAARAALKQQPLAEESRAFLEWIADFVRDRES